LAISSAVVILFSKGILALISFNFLSGSSDVFIHAWYNVVALPTGLFLKKGFLQKIKPMKATLVFYPNEAKKNQ
jgi:hypothetical protein